MMFADIRKKLKCIPRTKWGKQSFLLKYHQSCIKPKILDVGCGNDSPLITKNLCDNCYYVGVDINDYNQSKQSLFMADEYHVFTPEGFVNGLESLEKDYDCVVSSHNIEHCNKPEETISAMCKRLKRGGMLFMSFPNSDSVDFPHREGTLNFYDDPTHIYIPDMEQIINILKCEGMKIIMEKKAYKPMYYWIWGGGNGTLK